MSLHRCTEAECTFVGQTTTRSCRGHKADEQVLREQLNATLGTLGLMADAFPLGGATRNTLEEECATIRTTPGGRL